MSFFYGQTGERKMLLSGGGIDDVLQEDRLKPVFCRWILRVAAAGEHTPFLAQFSRSPFPSLFY
jgi:hypothetical protein